MKSVGVWVPLSFLCLSLSLLGGASAVEGDFEEEEGVLVLKAASFEKALQQFPHLLVEFCEWARAGGGHRHAPSPTRAPPLRSLPARGGRAACQVRAAQAAGEGARSPPTLSWE